MFILKEIIWALSFWTGIILCYIIEWYFEVYWPWPFKGPKT